MYRDSLLGEIQVSPSIPKTVKHATGIMYNIIVICVYARICTVLTDALHLPQSALLLKGVLYVPPLCKQ